jgi:hypothetical protein
VSGELDADAIEEDDDAAESVPDAETDVREEAVELPLLDAVPELQNDTCAEGDICDDKLGVPELVGQGEIVVATERVKHPLEVPDCTAVREPDTEINELPEPGGLFEAMLENEGEGELEPQALEDREDDDEAVVVGERVSLMLRVAAIEGEEDTLHTTDAVGVASNDLETRVVTDTATLALNAADSLERVEGERIVENVAGAVEEAEGRAELDDDTELDAEEREDSDEAGDVLDVTVFCAEKEIVATAEKVTLEVALLKREVVACPLAV